MVSRKFSSARVATILTLAVYCFSACTPPAIPTAAPAAPTLTATSRPPVTRTPRPTVDPASVPAAAPLTLVWQNEFKPESALGAPSDLAVDEQGNVYVSAQNKLYIKKFDKDGKFVSSWSDYGSGPGQFDLPTGIAADTQGNVYVDDFNNKRVQKFDSAGKYLLQWPIVPPSSPGAIGVDPQGNVYVSIFSTSADHVHKFDSNGNFIKSWGGTGSGDGQFMGNTEDMTVDNQGNVYVSDPFNHRIQKFDSDGNFLAQFGGEASKKGYGLFDDPRGVAVDAQGNVFILDSFFLQKLDADGNFIAQWPTTGGDLDRTQFVSVDAQGYIYVLARGDVVSPAGDKFNLIVLKKFSQPW